MAFRVYEESLDKACDEALATLDTTRNCVVNRQRYDWLYRDNPDGEAVLWSIRKVETGEMAGFTVVLPRRMLVDGRVRVCWNGADFSVHRKFRTLGVAIKLRRAAKEGVDAGRVDFLYAHPNGKMQIIHEKVGHSPVGTMVRYAKPLHSEPYFRRRLGGRRLAAVAAKVADPILRLRSPERRHRFACSTRVVESPSFDDRFDRLFEEANTLRRIVGVRDARYLDWRYGRNPLYQTHAVLAEEGGRLLGYALFTLKDETAHLKDVFATADGPVERDLVARLIDHARKLRLVSVSAAVLDGHPITDTLKSFGLACREDNSQMFGYVPAGSPLGEFVFKRESWLLSVGDRDV